jgi:hypothetical protein
MLDQNDSIELNRADDGSPPPSGVMGNVVCTERPGAIVAMACPQTIEDCV